MGEIYSIRNKNFIKKIKRYAKKEETQEEDIYKYKTYIERGYIQIYGIGIYWDVIPRFDAYGDGIYRKREHA